MADYLMRFEDGPAQAITVVVPAEKFTWPLPDRVAVAGFTPESIMVVDLDHGAQVADEASIYVKVSESQLDDDVSGVMRGALYRLERDDA